MSTPTQSFRIIVLVLLAVLLGLTVGLFLIFTDPPRTLFGFTVLGFFLTVELWGAGLTLAGPPLRREGADPGAARAVAYGSLGGFVGLGLLTILVYAITRNPSAPSDGKFLAILVTEALLSLVALGLFQGYHRLDESGGGAPERATAPDPCLEPAQAALDNLAAIRTSDPAVLERADRLRKELQAIQTLLRHAPAATPDVQDGRKLLAAELTLAGHSLAGENALNDLEAVVRKIRAAVRA